jgi:hypothetical protein
MELVKLKTELEENIARLETCLQAPGLDHDFAIDLVPLGICFVVTGREGQPFFAPSRLVGYRSNTRHDHATKEYKDGRVTNAAIIEILARSPDPSAILDEEYEQFCAPSRDTVAECAVWDTPGGSGIVGEPARR